MFYFLSNLLLFVELLLLTYTLSPSTAFFLHFNRCQSTPWGQVPATSQLRSSVVRLHHITRASPRAVLFKAALQFGFDLLWLRDCVIVLFFICMHSHTWEVCSSGNLQLLLHVNKEMKSGSVWLLMSHRCINRTLCYAAHVLASLFSRSFPCLSEEWISMWTVWQKNLYMLP